MGIVPERVPSSSLSYCAKLIACSIYPVKTKKYFDETHLRLSWFVSGFDNIDHGVDYFGDFLNIECAYLVNHDISGVRSLLVRRLSGECSEASVSF
jgi:hypothetical protein